MQKIRELAIATLLSRPKGKFETSKWSPAEVLVGELATGA